MKKRKKKERIWTLKVSSLILFASNNELKQGRYLKYIFQNESYKKDVVKKLINQRKINLNAKDMENTYLTTKKLDRKRKTYIKIYHCDLYNSSSLCVGLGELPLITLTHSLLKDGDSAK